jgi:hypothetical protein
MSPVARASEATEALELAEAHASKGSPCIEERKRRTAFVWSWEARGSQAEDLAPFRSPTSKALAGPGAFGSSSAVL